MDRSASPMGTRTAMTMATGCDTGSSDNKTSGADRLMATKNPAEGYRRSK